MIDCPICQGDGNLKIFNKTIPIVQCHFCDGSKQVDEICLKWIELGKVLKKRRLSHCLTLKDASKLLKLDVSSLSDMETGKIKPDMELFYFYP